MFGSFRSPRCWRWRSCWRRARRSIRGVLLTCLQGADVSDDGPTILHRNLCIVRRHRSPAVCNRVEEMSDGRLSQTIVVERSCAAKTPAHDHAVAVARQTVTDTTENVVAFTATYDDLFGDREWKSFDCTRIRVCLVGAGRRLSLLPLYLLTPLCVCLRVGCALSTFLSGVE